MLSGGLRGIAALILVGAGAAAVGCIRVKTADDDPDNTPNADASSDAGASAKDGGGPGADAQVGTNGCPSGAGPDMVNVGPFCIDSSEVTNAQYSSFLAAKAGDTRGQPAYCSGNTTYVPGAEAWPPKPGDEQKPVVAIEWCDAYAFCRWAGKRLCQAPAGGTDEWRYACSHKNDGLHTFPYGNTYSPTACNGSERGGKLAPVKSLESCQADATGFRGIYDLSGNAWEYVDDCKLADGGPGPNDECGVGGGGFAQPGVGATCDLRDHRKRGDFRNADVGFRCCASL